MQQGGGAGGVGGGGGGGRGGGIDPAESISSAEDDTRGLLAETRGSEERHAAGGRGGGDATVSGAGSGVRDIEASGGSQQDRQGSNESDEEDEELAYTAAHVTSILKPVAVTMIMVILCMKITQDSIFAGGNIQSPYLVYREESSDSAEQLMTKALVNSLVILVVVLAMTFVMYLLYKYNCVKFLIAWLAISVATLLAFSGGTLFYALATSLRSKFPAIDTNFFLLWQYNFAVVGVACVFWKSPLIVKQVYLVIASCIMAWILTNFFPAWTIWTLLFGLAVYDIFAVLAPCGPLKAIVELSQERGDAIPALIYSAAAPERRPGAQQQPAVDRRLVSPCQGLETASTGALRQRSASPPGSGRAQEGSQEGVYNEGVQQQQHQQQIQGAHREGSHVGGAAAGEIEVAIVPAASAEPARRGGQRRKQEEEDEEDDGGVKLGLGDFIFYSVLIGRAAMYDFATVVTCFIAIVTGLVLTLFCLAIARKALPALPFSIFLGIAFYFVTRYAIMPFTEQLQARMIFF